MRRRRRLVRLTALVGSGLCLLGSGLEAGERARPAPPLPSATSSRWIGEPATWAALRGKVVLLDVWTFG